MKRRIKSFDFDVRRIGVISDTHGLLRPQALSALKGSELIIHAGDIGAPEVLGGLEALAPVVAVRGNNDRGAWTQALADIALIQTARVKVYVIHNVHRLPDEPLVGGYGVVVSGHSHKPGVIERDGTIFLNPGSAGPRRFKLPVAVARLRVDSEKPRAKVVELKV